jgi:hypothetical protein
LSKSIKKFELSKHKTVSVSGFFPVTIALTVGMSAFIEEKPDEEKSS